MSDRDFGIDIVVNGKPEHLKVHIDQPMERYVKEALERSGNSGQPPEQWELRDATGRILDASKTVGQSGIKKGAKLFLNLKAGVGGGRG